MNNQFQSGDRVSFLARGKKVVAIVGGYHLKKRRGRVRELATRVTGDPSSLDRYQVVCYAETGELHWWRVTPDQCRLVKRGAVERREAERELARIQREIKSHNAALDREYRDAADSVADDNGLTMLRDGDEIELTCKGGIKRRATFHGFTRTGNVRFRPQGEFPFLDRTAKVRTCHPKFVKPV